MTKLRRTVVLLVVPLVALLHVPIANGGELLDAAREADAEHGDETVVELLEDELTRDASIDASIHVERAADGATAALDLLPILAGNRIAARFVLAALSRRRSHPRAWGLALRLRRQVGESLDLEHGRPFLVRLTEMYPDELHFRYSLADLLMDAGEPREAEAAFRQILQMAPDEVQARHRLAMLRELDARPEEALALYDEMLAKNPPLWAHRRKILLLRDALMRLDETDAAIVAARAAVEAAPPGTEREWYLGEIERAETDVATDRDRRDRVQALIARLDRTVALLLAGWLVLLGGAVGLMRRRGLL